MAENSRMVQGGMLKKKIQGGRMEELLDVQKTKAVRRRKWVLNTKKEGKTPGSKDSANVGVWS